MTGNLEAAVCVGVQEGSCVMLTNTEPQHIVYAGPICYCPDTAGMMLLLHQSDFDMLQAVVNKKKLN